MRELDAGSLRDLEFEAVNMRRDEVEEERPPK